MPKISEVTLPEALPTGGVRVLERELSKLRSTRFDVCQSVVRDYCPARTLYRTCIRSDSDESYWFHYGGRLRARYLGVFVKTGVGPLDLVGLLVRNLGLGVFRSGAPRIEVRRFYRAAVQRGVPLVCSVRTGTLQGSR